MLISKITRSYSRSINARNYNLPESWIKAEATYEAVVESQDNPLEVSKLLYTQAQKDVVDNINDVITKMKQASGTLSTTAATGSTVAPSNPGPTAPRSL